MLRTGLKWIADSLIALECKLFPARKKPGQKRVLIFRKDGMGDYIIFLPFLKYYREYFGDCEITLVVPKVAMGLKPLLSDFEKVIEFDNKRFSTSFLYRRKLIRSLVSNNFEIAIYPVFSREPICDLIIRLTGAKERIAFATHTVSDRIYTTTIATPADTKLEIERNRIFTEKVAGTKASVHFPTISVDSFDSHEASSLSQRFNLLAKHYLVVFVGAGARYRLWREERFAKICDYLAAQGITPVLCGGPSDTTVADKVITHLNAPAKTVNLTGQTNIASLAHLLKNSLLYFGNDTGAMHLAVSLGVPVVTLLGGGSIGRFFPYGDPLRNRFACDPNMSCAGDDWACGARCQGDERAPCIEGITVENALKQLKDLISYLA